MPEIVNFAEWSRDVSRRMRRAALEGDETTAEQSFIDGNWLGRAVGQLMLAYTLGEDTLAQEKSVNELLDELEPAYEQIAPWGSWNTNIWKLPEFTRQLHEKILRGRISWPGVSFKTKDLAE